MTLTNSHTIAQVVAQYPGHTAYWYQANLMNYQAVRRSWLYEAFRRAEKAGAIRSEKQGRTTVFFPASK